MPAFRPWEWMNAVKCRHVREAAVRTDEAAGGARFPAEVGIRGAGLHHPTVVDVHVLVAEIGHARRDHGGGGAADQSAVMWS